MAYLDLAIGSPTVEARRAEAREMTPVGLSAIERRVVLLSQHDGRASLSQPSRLGRMLRRIVGIRQTNTLADERLETLRQYAVLMRLDYAGRAATLASSLAALGFSAAALTQVRSLTNSFGADAPVDFASPRWMAERGQAWGATAILAAITTGGYALSADYFDDGQLGAVVSAMLFAILAPVLLSQRR